jgi:hypothetical protein
MVWCLVKYRDNFTFYLFVNIVDIGVCILTCVEFLFDEMFFGSIDEGR